MTTDALTRKRSFLWIACAALLATAALMFHGNSCGHDFNFHLLSWMEVVHAWHTGLLYPHWVQNANYGAGEPRLIFYPPASWYLGALLGLLGGWHTAPVLFVLLALAAGGVSMYLLAREWTLPLPATLAACLYVANPYAMFVAYERTAYGELLAAAWLPLMVLCALKKNASTAALGLTVAALWLTNSPAAVVGSYLLALLALGMWIAERKPWPTQRALGGISLGLGLSAFYIVPAAWEQRWVQIDRAITPGMRVEDSFLFAHTADAFHDQVLRTASWILVLELVAASLAAYFVWKKQHRQAPAIVLIAMLPLILFLQLPPSEAIWKYAPSLKFLQFPWRWLMVLSVVACVLTALALNKAGRRRATSLSALLTALIGVLAIGGSLLFFQPCADEDAVSAQVAAYRSQSGLQGTDEYTPVGADTALIQQHLPLVRVVRAPRDDMTGNNQGSNPAWNPGAPGSIPATVHVRRPNFEHWLVSLKTPEPGYAVLRLMEYPSWRVTVDGEPAPDRPFRPDGLIAIPVAPGAHQIEVRWMATRDLIGGWVISAVSLLALAVVADLERRQRRRRRV